VHHPSMTYTAPPAAMEGGSLRGGSSSGGGDAFRAGYSSVGYQ
jgi:hypothetical protein